MLPIVIPVAGLSEVAFFRLEGQANADVEIQASIRRGMIGFPQTRLVKISTPYMKSGVLHDDFTRGFGQDDPDLLVWRASTALMNPTIKTERLDRERRLDPSRFAREFEAEFAEETDAFLPYAWVEDAVHPHRYELPPRDGVHYHAAVDPSGGGPDAFAMALCHAEGNGINARVVVDVVKGWSRQGLHSVDLTGVVAEIAAVLKRYRVTRVIGDRYAGQWVPQAFAGAPSPKIRHVLTQPLRIANLGEARRGVRWRAAAGLIGGAPAQDPARGLLFERARQRISGGALRVDLHPGPLEVLDESSDNVLLKPSAEDLSRSR